MLSGTACATLLPASRTFAACPESAEQSCRRRNVALAGAMRAIVDGTYGRAPENGVRESKVYRAWQEFQRFLNDEDGYRRALQARGIGQGPGALTQQSGQRRNTCLVSAVNDASQAHLLSLCLYQNGFKLDFRRHVPMLSDSATRCSRPRNA